MFGLTAFSQSPFSSTGTVAVVYNVSISEAIQSSVAQNSSFVYDVAITSDIQESSSQSELVTFDGKISETAYAYPVVDSTFIAAATASEAITNLDANQATTIASPAHIVESITSTSSNTNDTHFDAHFDDGMTVDSTSNGIATQYVDIAENTTAENLQFSYKSNIAEVVENAEYDAAIIGGVLYEDFIIENAYFYDQKETITTFVANVATTINMLAAPDSEFIILGEMSESVELDTSIVAVSFNSQFMTEAINVNESSIAIGVFPAAQSESVSVFGTQISIGTYIAAIEENIAIFDGFDGTIVWILDMAEAINASDAYQQNQGYDVNINEATTNTSAITRSVAFLASIAEAFNATAAQSNTVGFLASVSNAITAFVFNDTASDIRVNVDENIAVQDIFNQGQGYNFAVNEAINIAVNLIGIKYFNYYITDGIRATSTVSGKQIATGNIVDEIQSASFYGNLAAYFDSINEFANIVQVFNGLGTFYVSLGDQVSITQSFGIKEKWIPADNSQNANWVDPSNTQVPDWSDPTNEQVPNWDPVNSI